jgi:hypothetical protein
MGIGESASADVREGSPPLANLAVMLAVTTTVV